MMSSHHVPPNLYICTSEYKCIHRDGKIKKKIQDKGVLWQSCRYGRVLPVDRRRAALPPGAYSSHGVQPSGKNCSSIQVLATAA